MTVLQGIRRRTAPSSPMENIFPIPFHGCVNLPLFWVRFLTNTSVPTRNGDKSFALPNRFLIRSFSIAVTLVASSRIDPKMPKRSLGSSMSLMAQNRSEMSSTLAKAALTSLGDFGVFPNSASIVLIFSLSLRREFAANVVVGTYWSQFRSPSQSHLRIRAIINPLVFLACPVDCGW